MIFQADLHTHTCASTHAYSTILENCTFANRCGLKAIAMTDHGMTMPDAPHVWHFHNLKALPRKICGVTVLCGVEANVIDYDGHLDIDEETMSYLEWVVASYHKYTCKPSTFDEHTKGYLKLAENNDVDIIGHPTTAMFEYDMERCVKKFKEYDKIIEINESSIIWKRGSRENSAELMRLAKKYDALISINTDAHYCENIGQAPIAIQMAQELEVPERLIINTDWDRLRERIMKKRPGIVL